MAALKLACGRPYGKCSDGLVADGLEHSTSDLEQYNRLLLSLMMLSALCIDIYSYSRR